jgi:hypothetical protein
MLLLWFMSEQLIAADKGEFSAHSPGRLVDDKLLLLLLLSRRRGLLLPNDQLYGRVTQKRPIKAGGS